MNATTYCYWSIGDGAYRFLLQTMVNSARKAGITDDFHIFCDHKVHGATTHILTAEDRKFVQRGDKFRFDFKLLFLKRMLALDYEYFIYLDADCFFTRAPKDPLPLLRGDQVHMFLESDLTDCAKLIRDHWWGLPHSVLIRAMRDMGVSSEKIYHVNAGFFMIHRDHVVRLLSLIDAFWNHLLSKGYKLNTEEPLFAYAMHIMCKDPNEHLLADHLDFYGMWYDKTLNPDGEPYLHRFIMTGQDVPANPAIVHCIMNKPAMMKMSMTSYEKFCFALKSTSNRFADTPRRMFRKVFKTHHNPEAWAIERVAPSFPYPSR